MIHQIERWIETETAYDPLDKNLLWICAERGKVDFVKYLLDKGYDVHAINDWALQSACKNGHVEVVKLLLDAGADVHAYDDWALRWASYNGHTEVVKLLKDRIDQTKKKNTIQYTQPTDAFLKFKLQYEYLLKNAGVDDKSEREQLLRVFFRYGNIIYPEQSLKEKKSKIDEEQKERIANITNKLIEVLNELDDVLRS